MYEGFFKAESSKGMAVERIIELVTHRELYPVICIELYFILENCQRLITALTSLEASEAPLACSVFNLMEDLRAYLAASSTKTSFGNETDRLLAKLPAEEKRRKIKSFQEVFRLSHRKLEGHLESHPAYSYYRAARIFDPRQLPIVSHDIGDYCAISAFRDPSSALLEEFLIYCRSPIDSLPNPMVLHEYWGGSSDRFPILSSIARDAIWMPVTSVDVERSFSQYKHLLNDRREGLTEENTKRLMMLYFNGDVEGQL